MQPARRRAEGLTMPSDIVYDGLTPRLEEIAEHLRNTKPLMHKAGQHLRECYMRHFIGRNGGRAGFWSGIAEDVELLDYDANSATVGVQGRSGILLMHKIYGGTILPKLGKKLAIPAIDEARAAGSPSEGRTPPLKVLFTMRNGKLTAWALAEVGQTKSGRLGRNAGRVWFFLADKAVQFPDLDALPSEETVESEVMAGVEADFSAIMTGNAAA